MEEMHDGPLDAAPEVHRRPGVAVTVRSSPAEAVTADRKLAALRDLLRADLLAADMKWGLFVASGQSYRCDSCLKPFPPQFAGAGAKDVDALREVLSRTPELSKVMLYCCESIHSLDPQVVDLLFWVLIQLKEFKLRSVPKKDFGAILARRGSGSSVPLPNHIFEVVGDPRSARATKWAELAHGRNLWCGFHGSRLENFYSILCHGLQQHMTKRDLFGPGIYLSDELSVSLLYSPTGCAGRHSLVGEHASCVALCQIIDHPDVKCQTKTGLDPNRSRSISSNSIGGRVPETYYVVQNSDLVRVQYLLVYSNTSFKSRRQDSSLMGWVKSHKMLTAVVAYIVMLVSVGLANSPTTSKLVRMFLRKIGR
ncbi:protein mono-ADP-ribosyltransferase PARP16-like isoform X2 [Bacillus rossius redtenbacheri]